MAGVVGLRYEGCAAVLSRFPDLDTRGVWIGLALIEAAFIADQARRAKAKHAKGRNAGEDGAA